MKVYVEFDFAEKGLPIRILRGVPEPEEFFSKYIFKVERKPAVASIRHQIYIREKGQCKHCGKRITEKQMHMDERIPRSKGGEISLANSDGLCYVCHIDKKHGNRKPRFTKRTGEKNV